jgi:eukaryotic-like serine/threonine-protein kinase
MPPELERIVRLTSFDEDERTRPALRSWLSRPPAERLDRVAVARAAGTRTSWAGAIRQVDACASRILRRLTRTGAPPGMIGESILHYRIDGRIGQGGMGVVYRATDLKLLRPVALKFIPPGITADRGARERFLREARAASALDHVNVGTIFGVEEAPDGRQFIAMAYYEGTTLAQEIARGPIPPARADDLVRQIAAGLGEAHARGIVHRDIKPSNVIVTNQGIAKIVDFGLASLAGSSRLTVTGTQAGTPQYMSPEQALGEAVDHRTDIWSLGVVLHEMLTGRIAFDAPSIPAVLYRVVHEELPLDGLDERHRAVLARALQKDPRDRFRSTRQMSAALDGVAIDDPAGSAETTLHVPGGARSSIAPRLWYTPLARPLLAAVVVVLVAVTAWATYRARGDGSAGDVRPAGSSTAFDAYLPALALLERWDQGDNLTRAIALLDASIAREPTFALGYARLAEAHRLQAAVARDGALLERAREYAERAASLNPDLPVVQTTLGKVYTALNQDDLAMAALQQALKLDTKQGDTHVALARLYERLGRLDEAQASYERGIVLQPDAWQNLFVFGSFHYRQGRYAEAIALWKRVIALTPDNRLALINLGSALLDSGRLDEAQVAFEQVLDASPHYTAYMNLGKIAFLQSRYADAARMFEQAAAMSPDDYVLVGNLAAAYAWVPSRARDAEAAFGRAAAMAESRARAEPANAAISADLAIYYAKLARPEDARRRAETAVALAGDNAAVHATVGEALEILGDRADALRHVRRALELGYRREELQRNPEFRDLVADGGLALTGSPVQP